MPEPLGIMLLSDDYGRVHHAYVLATGAAALGRRVVLFATHAGLAALRADWPALAASERDATVRARGVAGLDELRDAAAELDVRLIACEAGLRAEAVERSTLLPGVEVAGIATFLGTVGTGQIVSL